MIRCCPPPLPFFGLVILCALSAGITLPARAAAYSPTPAAAVRIVQGTPQPGTLRILSLNAEHLMSSPRFVRWQRLCGAHGWQLPDAQRPPELSYCDALNGRNLQGQPSHGPVRSLDDLRAKQAQLAGLIRRADADIVLMQEVSDREAAAEVLGAGWTIHSSEERWRGQPMAQHLVIAWRSGRFPAAPDPAAPRIELVPEISQASDGQHRTRPGLALHVEASPGLRLAILNLHLKAGCRHGRLDRSPSRQPKRHWRRQRACQTLQAQIPPLEAWIDQQIGAGRQVLISGDFNRDLRAELKANLPARADGSPAGQPIPDAAAARHIASLLPEIDDDTPPGTRLRLVRTGPYRRLADCHRHITPFLLSTGLQPFLTQPIDALRVQVQPFEAPLSLARPRPSDHCPHLLVLPWRDPKRSSAPAGTHYGILGN